eukprot:SAG22_NODE_19566_length_273_cov_1.482759_2_plen_36_part_01
MMMTMMIMMSDEKARRNSAYLSLLSFECGNLLTDER